MWDLKTIINMNSDEELAKAKKIALALNGKVKDVQDTRNLQRNDGSGRSDEHSGRRRIHAARIQPGVRS
tara:strand:- start:155 stop:361 length:207 start_codon:yes stop_codon:yes gene_type:complete